MDNWAKRSGNGAHAEGFEFVFLDRHSLSIEQHQTLFNYLSLVRFDYCINTAAYTAVDKAEAEREQALVINAGAVENLAQCCGDKGVRLIQVQPIMFSTVFLQHPTGRMIPHTL